MRRKPLHGKIVGIFAVILALFMAVGVAEEERTNAGEQWKYVLEDGGATITRHVTELGLSGDLLIPSEIDGYVVTGIGQYMLDYLRLTSVTIPDTVVEILPYTFSYCQELERIEVKPENPAFESVDGVLFDKRLGMLIAYPMTRAGETYAIPEGTRSIGKNAFSFRWKLAGITIPNSVTDIGSQAFISCTGLTSIVIPGNVSSIAPGTFEGCRSLREVVLMEGVAEIGPSAFLTCRSLTRVDIPSSVTSIGYLAFCNCNSLTSLTIPASVTSIGEAAFGDCGELILTVAEGSYAEVYAKENNIPYVFAIE